MKVAWVSPWSLDGECNTVQGVGLSMCGYWTVAKETTWLPNLPFLWLPCWFGKPLPQRWKLCSHLPFCHLETVTSWSHVEHLIDLFLIFLHCLVCMVLYNSNASCKASARILPWRRIVLACTHHVLSFPYHMAGSNILGCMFCDHLLAVCSASFMWLPSAAAVVNTLDIFGRTRRWKDFVPQSSQEHLVHI